jgi:hypothetical protein
MLNARPLKRALISFKAELALMISDYLYHNVVCRYPSLPPTRPYGFSGLVCGLFLLLEDQPADLEVQLLGVREVIHVAQRLILAR